MMMVGTPPLESWHSWAKWSLTEIACALPSFQVPTLDVRLCLLGGVFGWVAMLASCRSPSQTAGEWGSDFGSVQSPPTSLARLQVEQSS